MLDLRVLALVCLMVVSGCNRQSTPGETLPEGLVLTGRADALAQLLVSLEQLRDTPLARYAATLRSRVAECEHFIAHAPGGDVSELPEHVRCIPAGNASAGLGDLLDEGDLAFSLQADDRSRIAGSARIEASGSVELRAHIDTPPAEGAGAFLVPAPQAPGRPVLSEHELLVHGRLRPAAGLDIASWVAQDSQADALFKLKSQLFSGSVLAGNIEFASYLPRAGRVMPGAALAVDINVRSLAVAAMEKFIADLEARWPIHHAEVRIGGHAGACFFDLRILPEFAPCYVATDRALVVAWNPESIGQALAPTAVDDLITGQLAEQMPGLGNFGGLVVHLDRISDADERLRAALAPNAPPIDFDYAWERVVIQARREGEPLRVRVSLIAREAS